MANGAIRAWYPDSALAFDIQRANAEVSPHQIDWTPEHFEKWAENIGQSTLHVVQKAHVTMGVYVILSVGLVSMLVDW